MVKYVATVAGIGLAAAFVAVFFSGRHHSAELTEVAPRVGMSYDDLMALGPRVATQTGVTLGSSRRVVYLLACSGQASKGTIESQAVQAGTIAKQKRLSDREAVTAVLAQSGSGTGNLKGC
jgi:hypothetical protein